MSDRNYILEFDGGAQPNPGIAGCGWMIKVKNGAIEEVVQKGGSPVILDRFDENNITNNQAEYIGLIEGIKACGRIKIKNILIRGVWLFNKFPGSGDVLMPS